MNTKRSQSSEEKKIVTNFSLNAELESAMPEIQQIRNALSKSSLQNRMYEQQQRNADSKSLIALGYNTEPIVYDSVS